LQRALTIASSGWDTHETARKFETLSQRADALTIALGEAVDFQNAIGKQKVEKRIKALAGYLKRELKKIPGVQLHTSEDPYISGGLTAFSVDGVESQKIVDFVRDKYNLVIRTVGSRVKGTWVRVSTPIYVSYVHVDMLLEGIRHLAARKS
jgi:selenocysteine lyase/cysteine desulfurase